MITTDLLDDLERCAKALIAAPVAFHATESGTPEERHAERMWRAAAEDFRGAVTPNAIIHLVAIARAALAWAEARDDVRAFADEIDALYPAPITVGHEARREALGGVVKARAVALEAALRGSP